MLVSIIIPCYNEADQITELIPYLKQYGKDGIKEIIVADGGSTDKTVSIARSLKVKTVIAREKGRAFQMNQAAKSATGEILYFVHADTYPPESFIYDIIDTLNAGYDSGCYRSEYDTNLTPLRVNAWFTRFNALICRGGDQTLFIKKSVFEDLNGFKELRIMEDFEIIRRLKRHYSFKVIQKNARISARKYEENHYLKINLINLLIFTYFLLGISQDTMVDTYRKLIKGTKFS